MYNFSCPLCGDSKTNKKKARGFILEKNGNVYYTCHNCSRGMAFHKFMCEVDPGLYSEYQKERITEGLWTPRGSRSAPASISAPAETAKAAPGNGDPLRLLKRIDTLSEKHYARKFCQDRMLPDLTKLYHCPRFFAWTNYIVEGKFSKGALKHDEPRLVIPFLKDGKMFAYQGRSYKQESDVKYITIRIDESVPKIFNIDADKTKTVLVLEGPLDAMFLPNAVAIAGGNHSALSGFDPEKTVLVYDNEPRSPETKHKMLKGAEAGYGVVVWPGNFPFGKDINEMIKSGMDVPHLMGWINQQTFRGLRAESEIKMWSRA